MQEITPYRTAVTEPTQARPKVLGPQMILVRSLQGCCTAVILLAGMLPPLSGAWFVLCACVCVGVNVLGEFCVRGWRAAREWRAIAWGYEFPAPAPIPRSVDTTLARSFIDANAEDEVKRRFLETQRQQCDISQLQAQMDTVFEQMQAMRRDQLMMQQEKFARALEFCLNEHVLRGPPESPYLDVGNDPKKLDRE